MEGLQRGLQLQLLWQGVPAIKDDAALDGAQLGAELVVL